jgi:hypothetical protein
MPTVAQTLGVREQADEPLADYLRGKQLLLVVDNFEQLAEAATQLALLRRA